MSANTIRPCPHPKECHLDDTPLPKENRQPSHGNCHGPNADIFITAKSSPIAFGPGLWIKPIPKKAKSRTNPSQNPPRSTLEKGLRLFLMLALPLKEGIEDLGKRGRAFNSGGLRGVGRLF